MAKAYITSLPNTTDTQRTFVKTVDSPKVPAMDYRSGFKDVATAIDNTNKFLDTFSKMKYEGFQADLDRLELEHLHEMQDATDPCQLEQINEKWKKNYDSALKDDFWAKSYYKSQYYKNWQARNQEAQQKLYFAKQHEFAEICATDTLNKMAETASLLSNPNDVEQYIRNGEAMLAQTEHLTAENKYKLMSNFYKDTVSRLYNSDPNKAVAFLNSVGNKYDGYGVSSEEIKKKAEDYNKAKAREAQQEQARAERQRLTQEKMAGISLAQQVALGEIDEATATKLSGELSPIAWNEYRKASPKKSEKSKIDYAPVHEAVKTLPPVEDDSFDDEVASMKLNHSDWNASQTSRFNDLVQSIKDTKEKKDKSNPITVEDVSTVNQVKNGELIVSDNDIKKFSHGNSQLAKDFYSARSTYYSNQEKELKEKEKKQTEEEKAQQKIEEKQKEDISKKVLGEINMAADEDVASVVSKNAKLLTPEDWATAGTKISEARRRMIARKEKAQGEDKKKYEESLKALDKAQKDKNFNEVYDILTNDANAFSDSQINDMNISQDQKEKLKKHKKDSAENNLKVVKQQRVERGQQIKDEIVKAWEKKNLITNIDDILDTYPYEDKDNRESIGNWIKNGNQNIAEANWATVKNDFYKFNQQKKVVSDLDIQNFIENKLSSDQTGKNYQEMFEDLSKIRDTFEKDRDDSIKTALNNFDTVWGSSLYSEETPIEKRKRIAAKEFYHNLLLNQSTPEKVQELSTPQYIWGVVTKYKPQEQDVIDSLYEQDVVKSTLNSMREDMFKYNKKEKVWVAKKDYDYQDTILYRNLLNNALSNGKINRKDYDEQASLINDLTASSVQKLAKQSNTVLGAIYNTLSSEVMLGKNYNPAVMQNSLDEAVDMLNKIGINPKGSINRDWSDFLFRTPEEVFNSNRLGVLSVLTILGFKSDTNKADAVMRNGQIIKLGE